MPRTDDVFNVQTSKNEENPRAPHQIEKDTQTFFLVDSSTQRIFISNFKKKKKMQEWLKGKLGEEVLIKNIVDKKRFLKTIKSVSKIHLSAAQNLFTRKGILGDELTKDFHNYGTPIKSMSVQIIFQEKKNISKKLKDKLASLMDQKEEGEIKKLEVSGRYDDKFERVLNAEEIVDKINIDVNVEENGLFDKEAVFQALVEKIR